MATIQLKFDNASVNLTKGKFLDQLVADASPQRVFAIADVAEGTFEDLAGDTLESKISLDQSGIWKIPGPDNLNFKLAANVTGDVRVLKTGELFRYKLHDEDQDTVVKAENGLAYVSVIFTGSFELDGGAKVTGPHGLTLTADNSEGFTFDWEMHRAFPQTTPVREALQSVFEDIVLPFQTQGLESLRTGDYVRWEFADKLHFGMGAGWSLDKVLFAGTSPAEVLSSGGTQLAKLTASVKPDVSLKADFAVTYDHTDKFSVLLQRKDRELDALVFKADKSDLGMSLKASATFQTGIKLDYKSGLASIVKDKLLPAGNFPGKAGIVQTIQGKIDAADGQQQIAKLITDTNNEITKLNQSIEFALKADAIHQNTAMFRYHFDLSEPRSLGVGYVSAMDGDWVSALSAPGVTLDPGVLIERDFIRQTSVSFHFFDAFQFASTQKYFETSKLIYTGNQALRFQLESDIGISSEGGPVGHAGKVEVFFSAVVDTDDFSTLSHADVRLHINLNDHADPRHAAQTAAMLANASPLFAVPASMLFLLAKSDPALDVKVEAVIYPTAYNTLAASPLKPLPHTDDNNNWNTFIGAFDAVMAGTADVDQFPAPVSGFDNFERIQLAETTGQDGGSDPADRRQEGPWSGNVPSFLYGKDVLNLWYLERARSFLNLVEDLKDLPGARVNNTAQFNQLLQRLKKIVGQDRPGGAFTKPMLLALLLLMKGTISITKQPDPDVAPGDEFVLTFEVR